MIGCAAAAFWLIALIPAIIAPDIARTHGHLFMCALAAAVTASLTWVHGRYGCRSNQARETAMYMLGRERGKDLTEPQHSARPSPAPRISLGVVPRPHLIAAGVALCIAAGASMVWASRAASSPPPPVRQQPIVLPPTVVHESLTGRLPPPQRKTLEYGKANGIVASPAARTRPPRKAERAEVVRVRLTVPIVQKVAPLQLRRTTLRRDEPVQATAGVLLQPVGDLLD